MPNGRLPNTFLWIRLPNGQLPISCDRRAEDPSEQETQHTCRLFRSIPRLPIRGAVKAERVCEQRSHEELP